MIKRIKFGVVLLLMVSLITQWIPPIFAEDSANVILNIPPEEEFVGDDESGEEGEVWEEIEDVVNNSEEDTDIPSSEDKSLNDEGVLPDESLEGQGQELLSKDEEDELDLEEENEETDTDEEVSTPSEQESSPQLVQPQPVTNFRAKSIYGGVELNWTASESEVTFYSVGRVLNGKYEYLGYTRGTKFIDRTASRSQYNFYYVFPIYKSEDQQIAGPSPGYKYAKASQIQVGNFKAYGRKDAVELSWTAPKEGADYYAIGRVFDGKYQYLTYVSSTSYIDKNASKDDWSFYWVWPMKIDGNGDQILGICEHYTFAKAHIGAILGLKATGGPGYVNLMWTKHSNATHYDVYRKIGSGARSLIETTTKPSYVDISASTSEWNFYDVVPIIKNEDGTDRYIGPVGDYVFRKALNSLEVTTLNATASSSRRVLVKWSAVSGADGYRIHRKLEGNDSYSYLSETTTTSYLDGTAVNNITNCYKVYPYKMVDGVRVIGDCLVSGCATPRPNPPTVLHPDGYPGILASSLSDASYVVNTNTLKFHRPSCREINKMSEVNKLFVKDTNTQLVNWGYSRCLICKP